MESERINPSKHYTEIAEWSKDIGFEPKMLPSTGRIISGKAAIFLYITNSSLGFLENMIVNPALKGKERSDALDKVVHDCLEDAKEYGVQAVMSYSTSDAVTERAKRIGFNIAKPQTKILIKRL